LNGCRTTSGKGITKLIKRNKRVGKKNAADVELVLLIVEGAFEFARRYDALASLQLVGLPALSFFACPFSF